MKAKRLLILLVLLAGCTIQSGPDKRVDGMARGIVEGAGTGAITGFQLGASTGPGAAVGAGLGAVAGGIRGAVRDGAEEQLVALNKELQIEQGRSDVQALLVDEYKRRLKLHPTREIYAADLFFDNDSAVLRPAAEALVRELAGSNKDRLPWSRLGIRVYNRSGDQPNKFAEELAMNRAKAISDGLVRYGVEPRRIEATGALVTEPIVVDSKDDPLRYNQAVEILMLDR